MACPCPITRSSMCRDLLWLRATVSSCVLKPPIRNSIARPHSVFWNRWTRAVFSSSLMGHLENTARVQRFQKTLCGLAIEFRIGGFNAQEETVARSQSKSRHMENRVIGHGQTIQTEHPQHCG